ncbi:MAG: hypothetical protein IT286_04305 [Proteobacteria bacterium]|nr:hypothetical protein [Pseudomonadota bacterium]
MKKIPSKMFLILMTVSMMACQRAPEVGNGTFTAEEQTGTTIINNLCTDGTLNCVMDENPYNSQSSILAQLYSQCMEGCQNDGGSQAQCHTACNEINDTPSDAWESDELRIPDQSMAINVTLEICVDSQVNNTIKLQGPTMSIAHFRTPESQLVGGGATGMLGVGARGAPVGLNLKCKIDGLYNKAKVTYTPVTDNKVTIKNSPHTVIPFSGGAPISRTYRSPHVTEWGIPKDLRDQMNVGQHAWLLKKATGLLGAPAVVQFQHQNNDLGPLSLVHVFAPLQKMKMKFEMVFFAPAASE